MEHRIPKRDLRRESRGKVRSWPILEKFVDLYCVETNSPRGQPARMASAVRGWIDYLRSANHHINERMAFLRTKKDAHYYNRGNLPLLRWPNRCIGGTMLYVRSM